MTGQINRGENLDTPQQAVQQSVGFEQKTQFRAFIMDGGRVTVAPIVKWENIGDAFGKRDPAAERRELAEKAGALRELAADLIEQAKSIEIYLSQATSTAVPQTDGAASPPLTSVLAPEAIQHRGLPTIA